MAEVTSATQGAGGTIVAQLGVSHPLLQPGGQEQVGPSAIKIDGFTHAPGRAHAPR